MIASRLNDFIRRIELSLGLLERCAGGRRGDAIRKNDVDLPLEVVKPVGVLRRDERLIAKKVDDLAKRRFSFLIHFEFSVSRLATLTGARPAAPVNPASGAIAPAWA